MELVDQFFVHWHRGARGIAVPAPGSS
jgi:hypothetical protein